MSDTPLSTLSDPLAGSSSGNNSDQLSVGAKRTDSSVVPVLPNGMQPELPAGLPSSTLPAGQNSLAPDLSSSVDQKHSHSESGSRLLTKSEVKNGANGSTGSRSASRSHSSRHSSSRSSGKKHSRYPDHRHKGRKSSELPSDSRSRKHESQVNECAGDSNHKSPGKTKLATNSAEKRTRIVLQVFEEVLQNGIVVDSKVKQTEFITAGGSIPWPPLCQSPELEDSSRSQNQGDISEIVKHRTNLAAKPLAVASEKTKHAGKTAKVRIAESGLKRSSHKIVHSSASKRVRSEGKSLDVDNDEDHRIEMASTLLSLQTESPVKKVERQDNFHEVIFQHLKEGNSVMAKWTDKNFYAGSLSSNLGDGRWHVLFDDGGKKAVNESDIISVPHLSIGQAVMATFSDGSLCLKGVVKQPFYEKNRLFYSVEYNDGSKNFTEKFSRRDIFLTAELAATLLNKQSKGSDKLTKFADVDLNNIIPKRSRLSAQAKALDGSTDDSETESISSSVKSSTKIRKFVNSKSSAGSSSIPTLSKALPKSPIERKPDPINENGGKSPQEKVKNATSDNIIPPAPMATITPENSQDLLGPIPEEGSALFKGMTFLLTTADAGTANDTADSGRSSALFDIPHLIRQIESGGGLVHQTLENAQESADGNQIVLLAYTYLRTVKYMQCLAAGIPCVMHTWLIECCRRKELVDKNDYLLPSGYSIITNSLITDRSVFSKSSTLFNEVRFMLVSKNPRHAESWTSVLTAAKAVVVDDFPSSSGKASNSVEFIISDSTCPPTVVKKAQQMRIPVVSSEYVVQCLINGRRLSCAAHEKFGVGHK